MMTDSIFNALTAGPISMNLYEWPTAKPVPKPTSHWGLDKSYEWGHTN